MAECTYRSPTLGLHLVSMILKCVALSRPGEFAKLLGRLYPDTVTCSESHMHAYTHSTKQMNSFVLHLV